MKAEEVAHSLGVRTPRFLRSVPYDDKAFIIMDRVEGYTLEDAWPRLSWYSSIRLAWQLRRVIWRMRSVQSTIAGSLASGRCRSFWLDDRFGLPVSACAKDIYDFLAFWLNFLSIRHEMRKGSHHTSSIEKLPSTQTGSLVFTHHDLAPRNLMIDPRSELWLLDWDFAGFYPEYFEYASMQNFTIPPHWSLIARIRWHLFTWIAAGRYEHERYQLQKVRSKFQRFGAGRRFSIKAQATKSRQRASSKASSDTSVGA